MQRFFTALLVVLLCISLCACGKSAEASKADALILAIGEVTEDSGSKILEAQTYYDSLTQEQKSEVEHYQVLEAAQQDYAAITERLDAEAAIQAAYDAEQWGNAFQLSKAYLEKYPDEPFASKAQEYKENIIVLSINLAIKGLKVGDLNNARDVLTCIKEESDAAASLLSEIEKYIAIAGKYVAYKYDRTQNYIPQKYVGQRNQTNPYTLIVSPYMISPGEWKVKYSVELPGLFYLGSKDCFTYDCVGDAFSVGSDPAVMIKNPRIDTKNYHIFSSEFFEIYSTAKGYQVVHTMVYARSHDYEIITLTFHRQ